MPDNKWIEIWKNKEPNFSSIMEDDYKNVFLEMKRLAGWDYFGTGSSVSFDEFMKEYEYIKENLKFSQNDSVFELGCGAGANLYLFAREGSKVGGIDFAEQLVDSMKRFLPRNLLLEAITGEACAVPTEIKYDHLIAGGVFKYFPSLDYARMVLEKMWQKTNLSIGILRNPDEDFMSWKRKAVENYDEKYKDLPELYVSKKFLYDWASEKNLKIEFKHHHIEGAWNDSYTFDCFIYKK